MPSMHIVKSWFWPGLITIACLTTLAGWFLAEPIDRQLTETVAAALEADNSWASIEVDGRDLTLKGVAPSAEALASALKIAETTDGIRVVENAATLLPLVDPFSFVAMSPMAIRVPSFWLRLKMPCRALKSWTKWPSRAVRRRDLSSLPISR